MTPPGSLKLAMSLIEVLVVIAIIALLMAMLFPSLSAARESARRVICTGNLRHWGVAAQFYRDEHNDYLPQEGYNNEGLFEPGKWYNELPQYLGLPPYKDLEGANEAIRELPNMHVWICPSKNMSGAVKSQSGKNQFHYGMNQVLDGLGSEERPSRDAPDFPDARDSDEFVWAKPFNWQPYTVFMFDIYPNSPAGSPRHVATKFHGDYANVLYISGAVGNCKTDDLVTDRDFLHGQIIWNHPRLYWGYLPPPE